ncbi:MAG: hypothetical protein K1X83_12855 [Oligoflexia bacterium]|nr:hypothetical protein [Oligoflexia bacterium]
MSARSTSSPQRNPQLPFGLSASKVGQAALILSLSAMEFSSARAAEVPEVNPAVFGSLPESTWVSLPATDTPPPSLTPAPNQPLPAEGDTKLLEALKTKPTAGTIATAFRVHQAAHDPALKANLRAELVRLLDDPAHRPTILKELARTPMPDFDPALAQLISSTPLDHAATIRELFAAVRVSGYRACYDSLRIRLTTIERFPSLDTWNDIFPEFVRSLFALNPVDAPAVMMEFHIPPLGEVPDTTRYRYTFFTPERSASILTALNGLNADRYLTLQSLCIPGSWTDIPIGRFNAGLAYIYSPDYKDQPFPKFVRQIIDRYLLLDSPIAAANVLRHAAIPHYLEVVTNASVLRERALRRPIEKAPWLTGPAGLRDPNLISPEIAPQSFNAPFFPVGYYNLYWNQVVETALGIHAESPEAKAALIAERRAARRELFGVLAKHLQRTKGIEIERTATFKAAQSDSAAFLTARDESTYPYRAAAFGLADQGIAESRSDSTLTRIAPIANYVTCAIDEALQTQIPDAHQRRGTASLLSLELFRELALNLYAESQAKRRHQVTRSDMRVTTSFSHNQELLTDPVVGSNLLVSSIAPIDPAGFSMPLLRKQLIAAQGVKLIGRCFDFSRGMAQETLELSYDDKPNETITWTGEIPFTLLGALEANRRLLDLIGTSLCLRDLNLDRRPIPHRDIIDGILLDPLNSISILLMEAVRDDIQDHWIGDAVQVYGEVASVRRLPRLPRQDLGSTSIIPNRRDTNNNIDLLGQLRGSLEVLPADILGTNPLSNGIAYSEFWLINRFYIDKTRGPVSSLPDDYTRWNFPKYIKSQHNDAKFAFLAALDKREKEIGKIEASATPWNLDPLRSGLQNLSLVRSGVNPEMDTFYSVYEINTSNGQRRYGMIRGTMNIDPSLKERIRAVNLHEFWSRYRPDYAIAAGYDANAYIEDALQREEYLESGALDNALYIAISKHALTVSDLLAIQEAKQNSEAQVAAKTALRHDHGTLGVIADALSGEDLAGRMMADPAGQGRIASRLLAQWEALRAACDDFAQQMAAPALDAVKHSSNSNVFDGIFGAFGGKL